MESGEAIPGSCAIRRPREGGGVFGVHSDAVSACTVHPGRLGETAGMPPDAGFPASGHGPCHRPACPSCGSRDQRSLVITKDATRLSNDHSGPGTRGRGSLFACRVTTASATPSRGRCGSPRRPGGPQSNRQFLPAVRTATYAVRGLNSGGCRPTVGFISAVNGGAFSLHFRNTAAGGSAGARGRERRSGPLPAVTERRRRRPPRARRGSRGGAAASGTARERSRGPPRRSVDAASPTRAVRRRCRRRPRRPRAR